MKKPWRKAPVRLILLIMGARKKTDIYDVIVAGGGLAGLSLTALLADRGVRVLCLDRDPPPVQMAENFDVRTTAISFGSREILKKAGIWDALEDGACAIDVIHILDGGGPVRLVFDKVEAGNKSFGWIVENRDLRAAMLARVKKLDKATHIAPAAIADVSADQDVASVTLEDGTVYQGRLIVGADGRESLVRERAGITTRGWSYEQRAIVGIIAHEHPHENSAVEDFRESGPFAILPMADAKDGTHRSSLVWTEHGPKKDSALNYDDESFNIALQARFPERYGAVRLTGRKFAYPLSLTHAHKYTAQRIALVADAAHAIHPIAGQGLNLGFRDVALLADLIENTDDPGAPEVLQKYERGRRVDNMAMAGATDGLNRLFSNDSTILRGLRRAGLGAVARMPAARKFFMKQAMGLAKIGVFILCLMMSHMAGAEERTESQKQLAAAQARPFYVGVWAEDSCKYPDSALVLTEKFMLESNGRSNRVIRIGAPNPVAVVPAGALRIEDSLNPYDLKFESGVLMRSFVRRTKIGEDPFVAPGSKMLKRYVRCLNLPDSRAAYDREGVVGFRGLDKIDEACGQAPLAENNACQQVLFQTYDKNYNGKLEADEIARAYRHVTFLGASQGCETDPLFPGYDKSTKLSDDFATSAIKAMDGNDDKALSLDEIRARAVAFKAIKSYKAISPYIGSVATLLPFLPRNDMLPGCQCAE